MGENGPIICSFLHAPARKNSYVMEFRASLLFSCFLTATVYINSNITIFQHENIWGVGGHVYVRFMLRFNPTINISSSTHHVAFQPHHQHIIINTSTLTYKHVHIIIIYLAFQPHHQHIIINTSTLTYKHVHIINLAFQPHHQHIIINTSKTSVWWLLLPNTWRQCTESEKRKCHVARQGVSKTRRNAMKKKGPNRISFSESSKTSFPLAMTFHVENLVRRAPRTGVFGGITCFK